MPKQGSLKRRSFLSADIQITFYPNKPKAEFIHLKTQKQMEKVQDQQSEWITCPTWLSMENLTPVEVKNHWEINSRKSLQCAETVMQEI